MQCVSSAQHFLTSINHTGDGIPFDKIASASFVNLLHQSSACGEDFVVRDQYLPRDPFSFDDFGFEFSSEKAVLEAEAAAVGGNKRAAAGAGTGIGSSPPRDPSLLQATKSRKTVSVADVRAAAHRGRRGADGSSSSAASNAAGGVPGTAGTSGAGGGRRRPAARARTKTGNNAGPGRAACPPARLAASRAGGANRLALAPRASVARANAPPPPTPRTPLVPRTPLYRAPLYRPPLYRPPPPPPPRPPGTPWMSTFYSTPSAAFSGCRTRFPVDSFEKHFSLWRHDLMRSRLVLLRCHARHLKAKSSTENLAEVAPPLDEDVASWVQVAHDGGEDWEAEREQYMETQRCIWSKLRDPAEPETAAPVPPASVVEYPVRDSPRDNVRRRARANKNKGRGKNKNKSQCNVKGKIRAAAKSKLQAVAAAAAVRNLRRPPSAVPIRPLVPPPLPPLRPPPPPPSSSAPIRPKSRASPVSAARSLASVRALRRSPAPPANRQPTRGVRPAGSYVSLCGPASPGSAPVSACASARAGASRRSLVDTTRSRTSPHYTVRVRPPARGSRWSSRAASEPPGRRPRARRTRPRPARRQRPISATSTFSDAEG